MPVVGALSGKEKERGGAAEKKPQKGPATRPEGPPPNRNDLQKNEGRDVVEVLVCSQKTRDFITWREKTPAGKYRSKTIFSRKNSTGLSPYNKPRRGNSTHGTETDIWGDLNPPEV